MTDEKAGGTASPAASPEPSTRLNMRLPSRLDSLEMARQAVLSFVAPLSLSAKVGFNLELVLEESLMNVQMHAFPDAAEHSIDLSVWFDEVAVYLRFEDEGVHFDPSLAADPLQPKTLAEASPGGLGLMLVRKRARSVDYARTAGRNCLTITLDR